MGWAVLYIAFGAVALWLLGEVLLQYKARLRWRLLAFAGFLGVVIGVVVPSVIVIAVGAIAFAIGQTNVTLSFRRGFSTGWALGGKPGESRRRRARPGGAPAAEPTLQVSDLEAGEPDSGAGQGPPTTADGYPDPPGYPGADGYQAQDTYAGQDAYGSQDTYAGQGPYAGQGSYDGYAGQDPYGHQQDPEDRSVFAQQSYGGQDGYAGQDTYGGQGYGNPQNADAVYAPQPLPDETGQYGIYSPDARNPLSGYPQPPAYDSYDAYGNPAAAGGSGPGDTGGDNHAYGYGGYGAGQDSYPDQYGTYGDGLSQPSPYSDPYIGTQYSAPYDPYAQPDAYAQPPYGAPQPGGQGYGETPPGGVWVPQQREGELPPEQPPYPPYQEQGYDGQPYRY